MNIKKTANLLLDFAIKRLAEIFGILISLIGSMLFLSQITYSPNDPNFVFSQNTKIENLMGFQGSFISDLFFQSVGLMAYLIPFTLIITGINILRSKYFFLLKYKSTLILLFTSALAKVRAVNPFPSIQTVIIFLILTIKIR